MIYESKLEIDVGTNPDRPRPGRLWLRNLYHVHQRLCMAFPTPERQSKDPDFLEPYDINDFPVIHTPRTTGANFLYQILPRPHGRVTIIVRSAIRPNWNYAFHNARYLLRSPAECKVGDYFISEGEEYTFDLVANPTKKVGTWLKAQRLAQNEAATSLKKNGRRIPMPRDGWDAWLERKARIHGFELVGDQCHTPMFYRIEKLKDVPTSPDNGPTQSDKIDYHRARILAVRFQGRLRVVDAAKFKCALLAGIGPAKAFGCGLLRCHELTLQGAPVNETG